MPRPKAGRIQTVLGAITPEAMGVTLPHEHLLIDFKVMFSEPAATSDKGRAREPVSLANLGWVRQNFNAYNPSFDMPNDGGRMAHILALIAAGHQDQLLLSHDIAYKTSLVKYGGYGYHHLLVNVVPRLRAKGVDDAGLRRLLVENPARAFARWCSRDSR